MKVRSLPCVWNVVQSDTTVLSLPCLQCDYKVISKHGTVVTVCAVWYEVISLYGRYRVCSDNEVISLYGGYRVYSVVRSDILLRSLPCQRCATKYHCTVVTMSAVWYEVISL